MGVHDGYLFSRKHPVLGQDSSRDAYFPNIVQKAANTQDSDQFIVELQMSREQADKRADRN
jgi:hypothetical protein